MRVLAAGIYCCCRVLLPKLSPRTGERATKFIFVTCIFRSQQACAPGIHECSMDSHPEFRHLNGGTTLFFLFQILLLLFATLSAPALFSGLPGATERERVLRHVIGNAGTRGNVRAFANAHR